MPFLDAGTTLPGRGNPVGPGRESSRAVHPPSRWVRAHPGPSVAVPSPPLSLLASRVRGRRRGRSGGPRGRGGSTRMVGLLLMEAALGPCWPVPSCLLRYRNQPFLYQKVAQQGQESPAPHTGLACLCLRMPGLVLSATRRFTRLWQPWTRLTPCGTGSATNALLTAPPAVSEVLDADPGGRAPCTSLARPRAVARSLPSSAVLVACQLLLMLRLRLGLCDSASGKGRVKRWVVRLRDSSPLLASGGS